jgi:hypothetical protein
MQQQANSSPLAIKSDVDHGADDFDIIRYVTERVLGSL